MDGLNSYRYNSLLKVLLNSIPSEEFSVTSTVALSGHFYLFINLHMQFRSNK